MGEVNKTFIVQLPKDADFKLIRTQCHGQGIYLFLAHQNHSKPGCRAYKLKGTLTQLDWFKLTYGNEPDLDAES